jgi:hypothetical protein
MPEQNQLHAEPRSNLLPARNAACAVVAIDMGYGHLRPARSLAKQLGTTVMHADRPPLADAEEQRRWQATRRMYETISRVSSLPYIGTPLRAVLNSVTDIPHFHPFRDLSSSTLGLKLLERSAQRGLGESLVAYLQERDLALVTTFYSPATFADYHGYDRVFCVVTDSDINRVWAPIDPKSSKVFYFAPSGRAVRRLRSYGVAPSQIELTGFPLPDALVGGPDAPVLVANLLRRLCRLDPKGVFRRQFARDLEPLGALPDVQQAPHLVFAVGGAGAQAELARLFLPGLKPLLAGGRLRLTLVAGVREDVRVRFEEELQRSGLGGEVGGSIEILHDHDVDRYFDRFDELLADTDVLWTKPSELVFYAGLGLPLLLAPPVGIHESYNLRWAREHGAGLKQRDPRVVGDRLLEHLNDGNLAAAAWAGYRRLPNRGLYRICDRLNGIGSRSEPPRSM